MTGDCEGTAAQNGAELKLSYVCHYGSEALSAHSNRGTYTCTIRGNNAAGTFVDDYHDADKDMIDRHGPVKLTLSGDTLTSDVVEDGETPMWRSARYESAMHPGATWHNVWTRKN